MSSEMIEAASPRGSNENLLMPDVLTVSPIRSATRRQQPEVWLREDALGVDYFAYMGIGETYPDPPAEVLAHDQIVFDTATGVALDADGQVIRANLPMVPDTPRLLERIEAMRQRISAGEVIELAEPGPFALLATPRHANYYHFLFDDLGRLGFYEALEPLASVRFPVPPPRPWQRQAYELAGVENRLLALPDGVVRLANIWIAPRGLIRIDEPRGRATERILRLADRAQDGAMPGPRRIYVSREGTRHRRPRNEAEVRDRVAARGFAIVRPETMPVADQIRLFLGAEIVLGVHGSALANAAFMRPGGTLLEIAPSRRATPPVLHNAVFSSLAGIVGLRYGLLSAPSASVDEETHDFTVPLDWLDQLLERMTGEPASPAEQESPSPGST
jgi:capsular polysaccharide biosynthesis protein